MIIRFLKSLLYALILALIGMVGLLALITLIDRQKTADTQLKYFDETFDILPPTYPVIEWIEHTTLGITPNTDDLEGVAIKYTEAWQGFSKAVALDTSDLATGYFTSSALTRAMHTIDETAPKNQMIFMGMQAKPLLYHLDRSYFHLSSEDATFVRFAQNEEKLTFYSLTQECISSHLVLKSTGWRISDHERSCSRSIDNQLTKSSTKLPKLKGINYYPQASPWTAFWKEYDTDVIDKDIVRIKDTGANSLRIFLPSPLFIDPKQDDLREGDIDILENLKDFIVRTEAAGLLLIPTLFDFRGEVAPWTWSNDKIYLDNVFSVLADATNIAFIDLKNELDLDFEYQGQPTTLAWAKTMLRLSRQLAPQHKYSLGWSNTQSALLLSEELDVISYHDYENVETMGDRFKTIKSKANGKPVIISELGATGFDFAFGLPSNDEKQAAHLEAQLNQLNDADGVLIWTLYDYQRLDPLAVSGSFWHKGIQQNFGIYDYLQRPKGAHKIFKKWNLK